MNPTALMCAAALMLPSQVDVRAMTDRVSGRKISSRDLSLEVERYVLPNGLTVILSPDATAASAAVNMTFNAGTLYEPPARAGMAHLVEHVMLRGRTPDTDYVAMLEAAGLVFLNAFTSYDFMSFELEVTPEAVPLALWVNTDRMATLPSKLTPEDLPRHQRVVDVERVQLHVDVPYGAVDMAVARKLFPAPHPLRGSVIGRRREFMQTTLPEVIRFAKRYLVPANGLLTIAGRFDVAQTKAEIARTLGRLPSGRRAFLPRTTRIYGKANTYRMKERRSRQPRVSILWRLEGLGPRDRDALQLGGFLLSNLVDGAFGTQVRAYLSMAEGASYFRLDATLPYDKPIEAAREEADVFLRYLTAVDMPRDYYNAVRQALDRVTLFTTDTVRGRAAVLTALERQGRDPTRPEADSDRMWALNRQVIRQIAWNNLIRQGGRLIVHARPVRPRKPKLSWEERQ